MLDEFFSSTPVVVTEGPGACGGGGEYRLSESWSKDGPDVGVHSKSNEFRVDSVADRE